MPAALPTFTPMRLSRRAEPFSHPDWIYEIKHDGFRALAYLDSDSVRLVSRNGNTFKSFAGLCDGLRKEITCSRAVLDGEIVCMDRTGRTQFNDLFFRRGDARFFAFDLLWCDGEDRCYMPLIERKHALRTLVPRDGCYTFYCDHVDGRGEDLFRLACELDLEGIVAKGKYGPYVASEATETSWVKIRNRSYSQLIGREDLFDRFRQPSEEYPQFRCEE